jgi:hypothetical protein
LKIKLASPSFLVTFEQLAGATLSSRTSRLSSSDINLLAKYVEEEHRAAYTHPERK